jgi:Icc-related predicted phosphoesterase
MQYIPELLDSFKDNGIHILINKKITIDSVTIWGSPGAYNMSESNYSNKTGYWAFGYNDNFNTNIYDNLDSQEPGSIDILVTHEPPYGVLDCWSSNLGSKRLLEVVQKLKPSVHIFGHVHSAHGTQKTGDCLFVNAAISQGDHVEKPISFLY